MRHYLAYAVMLAVVAIAGCTALQQQVASDIGSIPILQNRSLPFISNTSGEQFDTLIAQWNNVTEMTVVRTNGFLIYLDPSINLTVPSCATRMAPTFNCTDILLEEQPSNATDLKEGDIVSFEINSNESRAFSEPAFNGSKIIERRIYRIGNDSAPYFVMKIDSSDITNLFYVRFDRVRGKVLGIIFDGRQVPNPLPSYNAASRGDEDYNYLVGKWNSFVDGVYAANIQGKYDIYYDRNLTVPALACTGSMRPSVDCNDLIFAYKPTSENDLRVGNIVSFRIAPNETYGFLEPPSNEVVHVMHRIYRITQVQGQTVFITKGDNPVTNKQTDAIYLGFDRIETKILAYFKDSFNATFRK